jgi:hypothetical protein
MVISFEQKTFLVGIGGQRCGTTWLYRYLRRHAEIWMPDIKEMHFWDEIFLPDERSAVKIQLAALQSGGSRQTSRIDALKARLAMGSDQAKYIEYFRQADTGVFGEVTPAYSCLPVEGFKALKAIHPRVKLIFILRDPAQRFWSGLCHSIKRGRLSGDPSELFDAALTDDAHTIERTRYDLTLERVGQVFDPADVLVLFFERLFTPESIRSITDFAGVSYVPADFEQRTASAVIEPMSPRQLDAARKQFARVYEYCAARFPLPKQWAQ